MIVVLIGIKSHLYGQAIPVTLDEAIRQMTSTYEYKKLRNDSIIQKYNHQSFKASILPQISLSGNLPNYNRSISLVTQPEGDDKYVTRSYATSNLGYNVSQLLPFTGGTISLSSNLERQDNFNLTANRHAYYFNLFNVSYSQALFSYNSYKWKKRTHELTQTLEKITYFQQKEAVKQKIIQLFFELLIAQREYELKKETLELYEYVFDNAQKLYQSGRISKEDMLGTQIEYIKAKDALNTINLENAQNKLKAFLKWNGPALPYAVFNDSKIPEEYLNIDSKDIIEKATKYNYTMKNDLNVLSKKIEQKQVKQSVSPTVSLSIGGGYNSQFQNFSKVFVDKASRLSASLSIVVPIYDGGIGKLKKEITNIQLEQINNQYQNDITNATIEYEKELQTFNLLINSIKSNKETLKLIQQRLDIMKINIENGRIDIQELMQANVQQLKTFIAYNTQIQYFYLLIYKYRYLTLTDVRNNKNILLSRD